MISSKEMTIYELQINAVITANSCVSARACHEFTSDHCHWDKNEA